MKESYKNALIEVALSANILCESAKEIKGRYALVSKARLNALREALKKLTKSR